MARLCLGSFQSGYNETDSGRNQQYRSSRARHSRVDGRRPLKKNAKANYKKETNEKVFGLIRELRNLLYRLMLQTGSISRSRIVGMANGQI